MKLRVLFHLDPGGISGAGNHSSSASTMTCSPSSADLASCPTGLQEDTKACALHSHDPQSEPQPSQKCPDCPCAQSVSIREHITKQNEIFTGRRLLLVRPDGLESL